MVFGYYIPGLSSDDTLTADALRAAGLGDRLADIIATGDLEARLGICGVNAAGPDGMSGVLITPIPLHGDVAPLRWRKEQQDAIDCGGFWLVVDREKRPTPTGLERLSLIDGYAHRLGDGQVWQCPVISQNLQPVHLPKQYAFADGDWYSSVLPAYAAVWRSSQMWSLRFLPEYRDLPWEAFVGELVGCASAAQALSVNYRVGPEELTYLGVLTTETLGRVLDSAIDKPFFDDMTSKKKEATLDHLEKLRSSLPGQEDSPPDTPPAEPSLNSSDGATAANTSNTSPSP